LGDNYKFINSVVRRWTPSYSWPI